MKGMIATILEGVLSAIAILAALPFGLLAFASWSDFQHRGCGDMPSEDWKFTSNCQDAFTSSAISLGIALLGVMVLSFKLWGWLRG